MLITDVGSDPTSDELSGLLRLVRSCDSSGAKGPERLIDEHDVGPVGDVGGLQGLKLLNENCLVTIIVSVFFRLTDAVEDTKITIFRTLHLLGNHLLRITVEFTTLRVADHHVIYLIVLDVVGGDLTRVSTFTKRAAILGAHHDTRLDNGLN